MLADCMSGWFEGYLCTCKVSAKHVSKMGVYDLDAHVQINHAQVDFTAPPPNRPYRPAARSFTPPSHGPAPSTNGFAFAFSTPQPHTHSAYPRHAGMELFPPNAHAQSPRGEHAFTRSASSPPATGAATMPEPGFPAPSLFENQAADYLSGAASAEGRQSRARSATDVTVPRGDGVLVV